MASQSRTLEEWIIPVAATLVLHLLLAAGLIIAGWFVVLEPVPEEEETEFEPEPEPKPRLVIPPIKLPEPVKVVEPEPPKVIPDRTVPRTAARAQVRSTDQPPPQPVDQPPAGVDGVEGGETIKLPDVYVSGDVEVGLGRPGGPGGPGGGGSAKEPAGEGGSGPPAPVSIAAIKKRAKPVGDVGFVSTRDYPEEARRLGIGGDVKVRLVVDATGKVVKRTLVKKLGYGLDELAMALAAKLRFEPALDADDRAVSSVVVWNFDFVPPD